MIKPTDIKEEIRKRPPLQRKDALKHYEGVRISWEVKFKGVAAHSSPEKLIIRTEPAGTAMYPDIYFQVPEEDRAQINLLHEDAPIWIDGEIFSLKNDGLQVHINPNRISFSRKDEKNSPDDSRRSIYNIMQVHHGNGDNVGLNKNEENHMSHKQWYEKPMGMIILGIVVTVVGTGIVYYLGWQ